MIYSVSPELYEQTARVLCDQIAERTSFLSGTFRFETQGIECALRTSFLIFRENEIYPEGSKKVIVDLIPVWWEFHTYHQSEELLNDFSFEELRALFRQKIF